MTTVTDPKDSYANGTAVWIKLYSKIWWPGKVVDEKSIPDELKALKEKFKQCIAVVRLINENIFKAVKSPEKIVLYSCDNKIKFINEGLSLPKTQKKSQKMFVNFIKNNFVNSIRSMEIYIGNGDVNYIENLEIEYQEQRERKISVKELFTPSSTKKSKKILEEKNDFPAPKPIIPSKMVKLVPKPSRSSKSTVSKKLTPIETFINSGTILNGSSICYLKAGHDYTTNSFDSQKQFMFIHEKNTEEEMAKKESSPKLKKRKNYKSKLPNIKKKKFQDELLKDLNDGDDKDILFDTSCVVPTTAKLIQTKNEVEETINNVLPTVCKPSTNTNKVFKHQRELLKNDTVPELHEGNIANTHASDKMLDFNEIYCKSPVAEVRLINSDTGLTSANEINDIISKHVLVKIESALDQIDESLSGFSTGVDKLNVNNVIDTHKKTVGIENQNIWIENSEMIKIKKTDDNSVIIDTDIIANKNDSKCLNLYSSEPVMIKSEDWLKQHDEEIKQVSDCKEQSRNFRGSYLRQVEEQPPYESGVEDQIDNATSIICQETSLHKTKTNDECIKKKKTSQDELNKIVTNYFTNEQLSKDRNEENNDPDMLFLKALLPDIKTLNPRVKRILKYDMMRLLTEANEQMQISQQETVGQLSYDNNQPQDLLHHHQDTLNSPYDINDSENQ